MPENDCFQNLLKTRELTANYFEVVRKQTDKTYVEIINWLLLKSTISTLLGTRENEEEVFNCKIMKIHYYYYQCRSKHNFNIKKNKEKLLKWKKTVSFLWWKYHETVW